MLNSDSFLHVSAADQGSRKPSLENMIFKEKIWISHSKSEKAWKDSIFLFWLIIYFRNIKKRLHNHSRRRVGLKPDFTDNGLKAY